MIPKLYLYGGAGVAVLVGATFFLTHRKSAAPATAPDTSGGFSTYVPPTVYGSGVSSDPNADPGGLNASTAYSSDSSISQLIASQLATAQLDSETTKYTANAQKETALAGYANQLAITKDTNQAGVEKSLADQLSGIVAQFAPTQSQQNNGIFGLFGGQSSTKAGVNNVGGTIGFSDGKISVDLGYNRGATTPAAIQATAKAA